MWLKNILLLILSMPFALMCQQSTRYYTKANGLPSNVIYHSIQDSKGFIWFSTDKGVSRFDGYTFTNYTLDDGLTDNEVFKMFEDSKGRIWFLTYNGKLCYYLNEKIFNPTNTHYLNNINNQSFFSKIIETQYGDLLFIRENFNELYALNDTTFSRITIEKQLNYVSLYKQNKKVFIVSLFITEKKEKIYYLYELDKILTKRDSIVSNEGYSQFFSFQNNIIFLNKGITGKADLKIHHGPNLSNMQCYIPDFLSGKNTIVYSICEQNKFLYINTSNGVLVFNSKFQLIKHLLPNQAVTSVTVDFEEGIWLTNKNGGINYFGRSGSIPHPNIKSYLYRIIPDKYDEEKIWLTGVGEYYIYDKSKKDFSQYKMPEEMGLQELTTDIGFVDRQNTLIGNGTGVLVHTNSKRQITPGKAGIKKIFVDGDTIYYARSNNLIKQHKSEIYKQSTLSDERYTTILSKRTLCLLKDSSNGFWLGTNDGVLYYKNNKLYEPFKNIKTRISNIIKAPNNTIAFCSDIAGIYVLKNGAIKFLNKDNGLLSNQINNARFGKKNDLWVASVLGLSRLEFNTSIRITNYTSANGLIDPFINDTYELSDSSLILATPSGLFTYVYTQNNNKVKPKINLLNIEVNSNKISVEQLTDLTHDQNNIKIEFTGISFQSDKNIEYWFSLNKKHPEWKKINSRTLTFIDLGAGKYNLAIKCKNIQNIWSDEIHIPIIINPPYYKTPFFLASITLLAICSLVLLFTLYRNKINKENNIKLLINETRQKAMRAQLNPHFIFNALNSIQYLFLSGKETVGQEYLSKFSSILRNTLNNSEKTYVTIQEELDNLKLYMQLEQIRKKEKFSFKLNIDEGIDTHSLLIPSMLLQPIVENAIWHGLETLKDSGTIIISINTYNLNSIIISIEDNGIGINASKENKKDKKHISKGTNLIRDRIKALNMLGKNFATFDIKDTGKGTIVEIILPQLLS